MANPKGFDPVHVDDIRVHQFIEELKQTVKNHPILPFNNASDIIDNLRLQFADCSSTRSINYRE